MTESVLDIMSGGTKAPGAFDKHSPIGQTVSGRINSVDVWDVRKFGTNEIQTWDDGRPQKQLRIVFQADPGTWTPQGEDDTGLRAHYVKAWNPHLQGLREALAAVGEQEPKAGGWISIRYDHDQPSKNGFDTKIYVYQYQPPTSDAANLLGGEQPQQQQTQPQQQSQADQWAQQYAQAGQQPQAQFQHQQTPVPPVANVHTPQGQVNPATGEIVGHQAPVAPVPPAQQQAPVQAQPQPVQNPWDGQPAVQPQAPQQQAAGSGMDAAIIKLVQANLPDQTIIDTLAAQGVTVQQVAEVRASLGQ